MSSNKKKFALWVSEDALSLVEDIYKEDNCKSKSEFIEKAICFYHGHITAKNNEYLPNVLVSTMRGIMDSFEERMAILLFKVAVELSMMLHVSAATNDIDDTTLNRLRSRCIQEVKNIGGMISFDKAVKFQKDDN